MSAAIIQQALPIAKQIARMGLQATGRAIRRRRTRRIRQNKWTIGARFLGNPTGKRRRRSANGRNSLGVSGVNTTISQPVSYGTIKRQVIAPMTRSETGNEELDTVSLYSNVQFFTSSYSINPVEARTFARLSSIASQYQRYVFQSVVIGYTPTCGTAQHGELAFGFASDPTTTDPADMTEFMGLYGAVRGPINMPLSFSVPAALFSKALSQYMCKGSDTPLPEDDNVLYSVGRFFYATDGNDGVAPIITGRLSISYRVTLNDPIIKTTGPLTGCSMNWDSAIDTEVLAYDDALVSLGPRAIIPAYASPVLFESRLRCRSLLTASYGYVPEGDCRLVCSVMTNGVLTVLQPAFEAAGIAEGVTMRVWELPARANFNLVAEGALLDIKVVLCPLPHHLLE